MSSQLVDPFAVLAPYTSVLGTSDVHIAAALARLGRVPDDAAGRAVVLAAALAARAPRYGDVCVDLRTVGAHVVADDDTDDAAAADPLEWPAADDWLEAVRGSALAAGDVPSLHVHGSMVYLDRCHADEQAVAAGLLARASSPSVIDDATAARARAVIESLLAPGEQRDAAALAPGSPLTFIAGGPGTGKTTTVAALVAAIAHAEPAARIALAAPTGKAAGRLGEAFHAALQRLPAELAAPLAGITLATIHRLLGARRGRGRDEFSAARRLPHDVVVVDEASMVSLPLMARLLAAMPAQARLVLVGDPGQLASVDAGAVLADAVGPALDVAPARGALSARIAVLRHSRRYPPASPLDQLARAVAAGDATGAVATLHGAGSASGGGSVRWLPWAADRAEAVAAVQGIVVPNAVAIAAAAQAGDGLGALAQLHDLRVLCAHRGGPFGVSQWNTRVEHWLWLAGWPTSGWYAGRPVLVTSNDRGHGLFNGDMGVVVRAGDRLQVAFADSAAADTGGVRFVGPARLEAIDTVHALTIHKSQGSEFEHVVLIVPPATSPLATRELLYTGVTRARGQLTIVGDAAAIAAAVERRTARVGGLGEALWAPAASFDAPADVVQ